MDTTFLHKTNIPFQALTGFGSNLAPATQTSSRVYNTYNCDCAMDCNFCDCDYDCDCNCDCDCDCNCASDCSAICYTNCDLNCDCGYDD